ncbi:MAG: THUMP domain-containing protein [Candidatus Bathyarchaeia archaeon]
MARSEARKLLATLGDAHPNIGRTAARGILGVKSSLNSRLVVQGLREIYERDPLRFRFTLKWVPIDTWTTSDLEAMRAEVAKLRVAILPGEWWRATLEKRRYTLLHKAEIIASLAELIDDKVDLKHPDKILRVEIIGRHAGMAILTPIDVFSTAKPYLEGASDVVRLES